MVFFLLFLFMNNLNSLQLDSKLRNWVQSRIPLQGSYPAQVIASLSPPQIVTRLAQRTGNGNGRVAEWLSG